MIRISLAAGGRPEPIEYTYRDADGVALDITGSSVEWRWEHLGSGAVGVIAGTVLDPAGGVVRGVLPGAVMDVPGVVDLRPWIVGGGLSREGALHRLLLSDPPGGAPTV